MLSPGKRCVVICDSKDNGNDPVVFTTAAPTIIPLGNASGKAVCCHFNKGSGIISTKSLFLAARRRITISKIWASTFKLQNTSEGKLTEMADNYQWNKSHHTVGPGEGNEANRFHIHTETHHRPQHRWQLSPDSDIWVEEMDVSRDR